MFIVTHAAIGALIGEKLTENPGIAFVLAFIIHFFTDLIPHGDTNLYKGYVDGTKIKKAQLFIGIDIIVTTFFSIYLLATTVVGHRTAVATGIIGGILPDVLVAIYEVFHWKWIKFFHKLHWFFHNLISSRTGDLSLLNGVIMEVIVLTVLLFRVI